MLPADADRLADGNCLFDAQKAVSLAQAAAAAPLSLREAGEYINAPRVQRTLLYRAGILKPRIAAADHGAVDLLAPADLDDLLRRLLDGAAPVAAFYARLSQSDNREMLAEAIGLRRKMKQAAPGVSEEFDGPSFTRWQKTAPGIFRPMTAIRVDGPLTKAYLTAFSSKLAMALYREHIGTPLPLDGGVRIAFFLNAGLSQKAADGMLEKLPVPGTLRQGSFMVPEQFAYRYNHDGKSIIAGLAGFNSNLHILMVATSNPTFYDFPKFAEHLHFVRPGELRNLIPRKATINSNQSAATQATL